MNVFLGNKDLELVFRGLMVLPWAEVNHLIVRLQNAAKNEDLAHQKQMSQPVTQESKAKKVFVDSAHRAARYGLRKDGEPRGKPGPKAKK